MLGSQANVAATLAPVYFILAEPVEVHSFCVYQLWIRWEYFSVCVWMFYIYNEWCGAIRVFVVGLSIEVSSALHHLPVSVHDNLLTFFPPTDNLYKHVLNGAIDSFLKQLLHRSQIKDCCWGINSKLQCNFQEYRWHICFLLLPPLVHHPR